MEIAASEQFQFFRTLDVSVIELVVNQLLHAKETKVDDSREPLIEWSEFFDMFCKLRESSTQQAINLMRSKWHPSTMGYAMEKKVDIVSENQADGESEDEEEFDDGAVSDDYTEDDASESSETSNTKKPLKSALKAPSKANLTFESSVKAEKHDIHPAFLGYGLTKAKDVELQRKERQKEIYFREVRAITKARKFCEDRLSALEKQVQNQQQQRLEKIGKLKFTFEETNHARKREFEGNTAGTTEDIMRNMKAQFDKENSTLAVAFQYELSELEKNHKEKCEVEAKEIDIKRQELRMLQDAEKSIVGNDAALMDSGTNGSNPMPEGRGLSEPNAARLEEFAKLEMNRCAKAVSESTTALQRTTSEYKVLRDELSAVLNDTSEQVKKNPAALRKLQEARSMMNIAETRLKEAAKQTKLVVEELNDAEALLAQANWRKNQEEELLPLFSKFMMTSTTYSASKKKIIIALILLAKGNFEQKFDLFMIMARLSSSKEPGLSAISSSRPQSAATSSYLTDIVNHYQQVYSLFFIIQFSRMSYEVLTAISLIPFNRIDKDLENYLKRNFFSIASGGGDEIGSNSSISEDLVTISEYEMKALLVKYVIYIGAEEPFGVTSTIFQIKSTGSLSNYSLLQASSLSLLKHGIYDFISTAKDLHYATISYKPALENNRKRDIHEAALSMGTIDPMKPDYTKFLIKQETSKSYFIVPHDTKHFTSTEYYEQRRQWKYVIKVQSLMRAYIHRQISWKIAKFQAYEEAKHTAVKQLKTKMLKEYQKREGSKGLGKMKWDAEVRIKQAKLRAAGQQVSRSETVMIMMEENIEQAKQLIEEKFHQILVEEKIIQYATNSRQRSKQLQQTQTHSTITPKIHFNLDFEVIDSHLLKQKLPMLQNGDSNYQSSQGEGQPESEPALDRNVAVGPDGVMDEKKKKELEEAEEKKKKDAVNDAINEKINAALVALGGRVEKKAFPIDLLPIHLRPKTIERATIVTLLKGFFAHHHRENYENAVEAMVRLSLASSEVESTFHLYHRLRMLHKRLTDFKAMEIISEFPAKRLLLKYITKNTLPQLKEDLMEQFKFKYEIETILAIFQRLSMTDIDSGLLMYSLLRIQHNCEGGLLKISNDHINRMLRQFVKYLDLKMESSGSSGALKKGQQAVSNFVEDEYRQTEEAIERMETLYQQQYKKVQDDTFALKKVSMSLSMQKEKLLMIRNHPSYQTNSVSSPNAKGKKKLLTAGANSGQVSRTLIPSPIEDERDHLKNITPQIRQNWMLRYSQALKLMLMPGSTAFDGMYELQSLLQEFVATANQCARTIIHELYLPDGEKTIPVFQSSSINGRPATKRGINGRRMNFYSHGLFFKVCLDYDGFFNGSDEYAGKVGSKDRLGAQVINDCQINGMTAPLTLTIDYFGFRILATAKLPIETYTFSEDGLIKRMKVELLHGLDHYGENMINKNRIASNLFRQVGTKCNIIEHQVKGKLDFSSTLSYGAHLQFYKSSISSGGGSDAGVTEEFYLRHCWNIFPHELSSVTSSFLRPTAQDQAIFWRFMRPEYLVNYKKPLSTDVGTILCYELPDEKEQLDDLLTASKNLFSEVIPRLTLQLIQRYATNIVPNSGSSVISSSSVPFSFTAVDGESLTTDLHKNGVNIRHMGLIRSLLWRKLPSKCSIYHFEDVLFTSSDVASEVQYGDFLRFSNEETVFTVMKNEKHNITASTIPLNAVYSGDSLHETEVWIGKLNYNYKDIRTDSLPLRHLLLLEMVIRTLKQMIRYQLRSYVEENHATSTPYERHLFTYYCNTLTCANYHSISSNGSSAYPTISAAWLEGGEADEQVVRNNTGGLNTTGHVIPAEKFFHEMLFMNVQERFGPDSIRYSERKDILPTVQQHLPYVIHRLAKMVGMQFSLSTMLRFQSQPLGFIFIPEDVIDQAPVTKHSATLAPFIEAMTIAKRGKDLLNNTYQNVVIASKPVLFYTLSERKASRYTYNHGLIGKDFSGLLHDGCILEQSGPIFGEKFLRSIAFRASATACIDVNYDSAFVPNDPLNHFSVEIFFNCMGGNDSKRTIIRNGRYHIGISRENMVYVTLYESVHSLSLDLFPVKLYQWEHLIITFDGTTIRFYRSGQLIQENETERYFYEREHEFQQEYQQKQQNLQKDLVKEINELKSSTNKEATQFFTTKEGISTLKSMATTILENEPEENLPNAKTLAAASGEGNNNRVNVQRERKAWATKKAKEQYIKELYETNVNQVKERYEQLLVDLKINHERQIINADEESMKSIRLGASHADANNRHGDAYFTGNLSCFSVYDYCLTSDQIRQHSLSSKRNIHNDVQRIYHEAIIQFQKSIQSFTFNSDMYLPFMSTYTDCLLYLLQVEPKEREILNSISVISEIKILIDIYLNKNILEPLVLLINEIPKDPEFAELIVYVILSLKIKNSYFLSRTSFIQRDRLVFLPMEFGLTVPNRPRRYYEAAAYIFQEVCRDVNYSFVYGGGSTISQNSGGEGNNVAPIDLKWITELKHEKLIISLVQTAYESKQMKILELSKFYDYMPSSSTSSTTSYAGSSRLRDRIKGSVESATSPSDKSITSSTTNNTRQSFADIASNKVGISKQSLPTLTEDYNPLLQESDTILATIDEDVQILSYHLPNLEGLDLSYFISLTDFAMEYIKRFSSLKILILNECYEITDKGLSVLHKSFPYLEHLSLQRLIQITDEGLLGFSNNNLIKNLQILNCNYCIQITLLPIISLLKNNYHLHTLGLSNTMITDEDLLLLSTTLKQYNHNIINLDISYCSKITDIGIQSLSENCKNMKILNMKGLQRITSLSIQMFANRCWLLEKWYLDDIYLLTDTAFSYDGNIDGRSQTMEKMLSSLQILSLNYCDHLRNHTLRSLGERCRRLHTLQLAGCYGMNDIGLSYLMDPLLCPDSNVSLCQTLRSLNLAFVTKITGKQLLEMFGVCPMLERLDLSGLSSVVTDDFIKAICQLLPSLQSLKVNSCIQVTNVALCHIAQSLWLEELQINACHHITDEGIEVIGETCLGLKIFHLLRLRYVHQKTIDFVKKNCPILQEILYDDEEEIRRMKEKEREEQERVKKEKKLIQKNELDAMNGHRHDEEGDEKKDRLSIIKGSNVNSNQNSRRNTRQGQVELMKKAYPENNIAEDMSLVTMTTVNSPTANSTNVQSRVNSAMGTSRPETSMSNTSNPRVSTRK